MIGAPFLAGCITGVLIGATLGAFIMAALNTARSGWDDADEAGA